MIYLELKKRFEQNANSERAEKMAKYMKNHFKFYGIQTPERKKIYRDFIKQAKQDKSVNWELLKQCFDDDYREMQYFVMDYLVQMQQYLTFENCDRLYYFVKNKQWWDTIDGFDRIIGNIGLTDSRMDELMLQWSIDDDFWLRRIAIDHQLLRKEKTNVKLLSQIIINNLEQTEFFINKAIGWSLREYSKTDSEWVREFINQNRDKMAKLSVREASKYI